MATKKATAKKTTRKITDDSGTTFTLSTTRISEQMSGKPWRYMTLTDLRKAVKATGGTVFLHFNGDRSSGYECDLTVGTDRVEIGCKTFLGKDAKRLISWAKKTAKKTAKVVAKKAA